MGSTIAIIAITLLFSAFFSGMEIAYLSRNRLREEIDRKQSPMFNRIAELFSRNASNYITTIRLNAARKLLSTTKKSVTDIAAEVGFFDQSHFTRAFKRERGITPGQYRRQFWNE